MHVHPDCCADFFAGFYLFDPVGHWIHYVRFQAAVQWATTDEKIDPECLDVQSRQPWLKIGSAQERCRYPESS